MTLYQVIWYLGAIIHENEDMIMPQESSDNINVADKAKMLTQVIYMNQ